MNGRSWRLSLTGPFPGRNGQTESVSVLWISANRQCVIDGVRCHAWRPVYDQKGMKDGNSFPGNCVANLSDRRCRISLSMLIRPRGARVQDSGPTVSQWARHADPMHPSHTSPIPWLVSRTTIRKAQAGERSVANTCGLSEACCRSPECVVDRRYQRMVPSIGGS